MAENRLITKMQSCKWLGTAGCPNMGKMKTIVMPDDPKGGVELPTVDEFIRRLGDDAELCKDCAKYEKVSY